MNRAEPDGLREAVIEYLAADEAMPEFAPAQRMEPEDWDRLNRRWKAAKIRLDFALARGLVQPSTEGSDLDAERRRRIEAAIARGLIRPYAALAPSTEGSDR